VQLNRDWLRVPYVLRQIRALGRRLSDGLRDEAPGAGAGELRYAGELRCAPDHRRYQPEERGCGGGGYAGEVTLYALPPASAQGEGDGVEEATAGAGERTPRSADKHAPLN
jgi:hypothetical protein